MKKTFSIAIFLTIAGCFSETNESDNTMNANESAFAVRDSTIHINTHSSPIPEPVIGERIDGPAYVRDSINGKLLFTLYDHTLVTCTRLVDDWYFIGLSMDIDISKLDISEVREGQKIIVDGKIVGEFASDMSVYTGTNNKKVWADLTGYTHKDNIKPGSIIEEVLSGFMETNNRSLDQYRSFIQNFDLEKDDQFKEYIVYYNYENWLDDPSPMWRIALVFQDNILLAVLHSRPLNYEGMTDHKLDRGFDCLIYNEYEKPAELVKVFNHFVNSVD